MSPKRIWHRVRVQINVAEFGNDEIKDIGLAHLFDLVLELEKIEDGADVGRKAFDVADQMLFDMIRVAFQLLESQRRMVVKTLPSGIVENFIERLILVLVFDLVELAQHRRLGWLQHAIEAAQHGHGQHYAFVLRRTVRAAQQVGNLPDKIRKVIMVRHGSKSNQFRIAVISTFSMTIRAHYIALLDFCEDFSPRAESPRLANGEILLFTVVKVHYVVRI